MDYNLDIISYIIVIAINPLRIEETVVSNY